MPLTAYARAMFVSPGYATFESAAVEDLSDLAAKVEELPPGFLLRDIFIGPLPDRIASFARNLVYRADCLLVSYETARVATDDYLSHRSLLRFFRALHGWERVLSNIQLAYEFARHAPTPAQKAFATGDGSPLQRVFVLSNASKHPEKTISPKHQERHPFPLDLSNDGPSSSLADGTRVVVTFAEIATLCRQIGEAAIAVSTLDAPPSPG